MKEWYLSTPQPNICSGYESDVISEYAQSNFTDVLETDFSDTVILYNSDLSESKKVQCIIQNNTANTQIKSLERTILFPIGTSVAGLYVYFDGAYWLLTGYPGNNKVYEKITANLCEFKLRWQNSDGKIIERWVYSVDFTKYSSGTIGNKIITVGDNQYGILIPIDSESKKLDRDMRFTIDFDDALIPDTYKLSNRKVFLNNYQSSKKGGTLILTLSFDFFNSSTDKHILLDSGEEVWIADYIEPSTLPSRSDESNDSFTEISCKSPVVKIGALPSRFYAIFRDENGNEVEGVDSVWSIESDFDDKLISAIDNSCIMISVNDRNLVDEKFKLTLSDSDGVFKPFELIVSIETIF